MKLNKKQVELINQITETMQFLQEESESADTSDRLTAEVEELLLDMGKIDKRIF